MIPLKYNSNEILLIDKQVVLDNAIAEISKNEWLALDTEFEREKKGKYNNYRLCLVQIAIPGKVFLIDMLAKRVKFNVLYNLLENERILKIIHSPSEDIRLLQEKRCYIQNIFDPQKAVYLMGISNQSLGLNSLLDMFLNFTLDKEEQRSKWSARPLSIAQLKYAANDVLFLKKLKDKINLLLIEQKLSNFAEIEFDYACNLYREIKICKIKKEKQNVSAFDKYILKGLLYLRYDFAIERNIDPQVLFNYKVLVDYMYNGADFSLLETNQNILSKKWNNEFLKNLITETNRLKEEAINLKLATIPFKIYRNRDPEKVEVKSEFDKTLDLLQDYISKKYNPVFAHHILNKNTIYNAYQKVHFYVLNDRIKILIEEAAVANNINITNFKFRVMTRTKARKGDYNAAPNKYANQFNNCRGIEVSQDGTCFTKNGKKLFDKVFLEILKFHPPGLAPVCDESGWYHINIEGKAIYKSRYKRAFGYYDGRATVVDENNHWFHIKAKAEGERCYNETYAWCGNYQENRCPVRDFKGDYFHLNMIGEQVYKENYLYAGDYKDGYCCVKSINGWKHIDKDGNDLNGKHFLDLGVFHKNFATAKDENGWFHINKKGEEIYPQRYLIIEPFYNGFALVTLFDNSKKVMDEKGNAILEF